jgi:hypothetical protein
MENKKKKKTKSSPPCSPSPQNEFPLLFLLHPDLELASEFAFLALTLTQASSRLNLQFLSPRSPLSASIAAPLPPSVYSSVSLPFPLSLLDSRAHNHKPLTPCIQ